MAESGAKVNDIKPPDTTLPPAEHDNFRCVNTQCRVVEFVGTWRLPLLSCPVCLYPGLRLPAKKENVECLQPAPDGKCFWSIKAKEETDENSTNTETTR